MSVRIDIDIAGGNAKRDLYIELTSEPHLDADGRRDLTEVGEYAVILGRPGGRDVIATFHHRYGDDVLALITSAIAALRREGVDRA